MKKKIVFVITKSNFGGAQRYVFDLATSLPTNDFEVLVLLGGNGVLKEMLENSAIRTISLCHLQRDINLKNELLSFIEFYKIFKKERPDIVHGNSSKAGGIASFISRITGVPKIIFTAHAWAFNENRDFLSRALISFLHWFNIILSDKTITVSESVKNQVAHFPFIENKIKAIHLGINSPIFESKQEKPGFNIVTLAELHPIKGLVFVLDAIKSLDVTYTIFGEGDQKEYLQNYILKNNLTEKVFIKGFVPGASKFLKNYDLFILPSLSEALGYVLLEAGLAQIPVIASNVGGIPEVIEDKKTGLLFSPQNSQAIKESIKKIMDDYSSAQNMANNLAEKVKEEFSLELMVKKTIEIYH